MTHALTKDEFTAWLERYKAAWERRDPAMAAALFTPDATYAETPFDPPFEGREAITAYWRSATSGQTAIAFSYELLACEGDEGLCHWHAKFTGVPGGEVIDLDGMFRCAFADGNMVRRFREWWHLQVVPAAGAT